MDYPALTRATQHWALAAGTVVAPLLIVAIHFSTSLTLVFSILLALLWLLSGRFRQIRQHIEQIPAAGWIGLLFALMAISTLYADAPFNEALSGVSKYRKLLLIPILLPFLAEPRHRKRCEMALVAALLFSLLVSYAWWLDIITKDVRKMILKHKITHSDFMAFLAFYCMHRLAARDRQWPLWTVAWGLAVYNLFFIVDGRTGQLAFLVLCGLFFLQTCDTKKALLAMVALIAAFALFMAFSEHAARLWDGIHHSLDFFEQKPNSDETSMGLRLRFWGNALAMIGQAPWFGHGIGSFSHAFRQQFPDLPILDNPHNEFLLTTVHLGVVGLVLLLGFIGSAWQGARHTAPADKHLLQGAIAILVIACLFNSPIYDHTDGHWFMVLIALFSASLLDSPCSASSSSLATKPSI